MRLLKNRRGMSLVEAVMGIIIISMVSVVLVAMLSQSISGWYTGTAQTNVTNAATIAAQKLAAEIRDGKSATVSGGVLAVTFPKLITDSTTGEQFYDLSGSDPVIRLFFIENNNLVKMMGSDKTIIMRGVQFASDVNGVPMVGADRGEVNVTLLSIQQIGQGTRHDSIEQPTQTVEERITLRNYRNN